MLSREIEITKQNTLLTSRRQKDKDIPQKRRGLGFGGRGQVEVSAKKRAAGRAVDANTTPTTPRQQSFGQGKRNDRHARDDGGTIVGFAIDGLRMGAKHAVPTSLSKSRLNRRARVNRHTNFLLLCTNRLLVTEAAKGHK